MSNTVRILRSTTAGNVPSSLVSGQIAVNEADGKLFYRAANGTVTQLASGGGSSLSVHASASAFPATGSSTALYLAEDTSRLYQWESPVYVEVGVSGGGIATTSASDLTSGTLADARLSSAIATYSKIQQWIHSGPANGIDVYQRGEVLNQFAQQAGIVFYTFFTPAETLTVSSITMATGGTAGSGVTFARMGLYTFDDSTTALALVARTANDTTLFTAALTAYTRSFDTTGGYPASYTLTAGTRYGVAVLTAATTFPNYAGKNVSNPVTALLPRTAAGTASATDLAAVPPGIGGVGNHVWARLS